MGKPEVGNQLFGDVRQLIEAAKGRVVASLASNLNVRFGRGWSKRNLMQMIKFSDNFPDFQIVQTVSAQLSWSHFVTLIAIDDSLKREFYLAMVAEERWSTRTLVARQYRIQIDDEEHSIELLELWTEAASMWRYLTVLPPREVLQAKLQQSIQRARQRLNEGDREG